MSSSNAAAWLLVPAGSSRYASDFEEMRTLGRGGHGVVVAARNRCNFADAGVLTVSRQADGVTCSDKLSRLLC